MAAPAGNLQTAPGPAPATARTPADTGPPNTLAADTQLSGTNSRPRPGGYSVPATPGEHATGSGMMAASSGVNHRIDTDQYLMSTNPS